MKLCMVLGNYSKTTDTVGQWLSYNPTGLCTVPWFGLFIFRAAVNGSVRCRTAWEVKLHALSLTTDLSHNAEPFSLMASQHISTYMWQSDDVIFFVIYFHHMWMFSLIFIQTSTAPSSPTWSRISPLESDHFIGPLQNSGKELLFFKILLRKRSAGLETETSYKVLCLTCIEPVARANVSTHSV